MNRNLTLLSALAAVLVSPLALSAQAAAPAAAPAPAPVAIPAQIALIAFEQAVFATNEGQTAAQGVQKKYEPKKAQIEALAKEVDSLKKQLQAAPTTLADDERASRLRAIDTKEKQLNRDAEDATTAYNADLQEAEGKVAQKLSTTMKNYAQSHGFTLLLDVSAQGSNVLWALQSTEITQAVVDDYNKTSGVAAPAPNSPTPAPARRPAPAAAPKAAPAK
jgi:Skp family chaperone for outer membrane proteins